MIKQPCVFCCVHSTWGVFNGSIIPRKDIESRRNGGSAGAPIVPQGHIAAESGPTVRCRVKYRNTKYISASVLQKAIWRSVRSSEQCVTVKTSLLWTDVVRWFLHFISWEKLLLFSKNGWLLLKPNFPLLLLPKNDKKITYNSNFIFFPIFLQPSTRRNHLRRKIKNGKIKKL